MCILSNIHVVASQITTTWWWCSDKYTNVFDVVWSCVLQYSQQGFVTMLKHPILHISISESRLTFFRRRLTFHSRFKWMSVWIPSVAAGQLLKRARHQLQRYISTKVVQISNTFTPLFQDVSIVSLVCRVSAVSFRFVPFAERTLCTYCSCFFLVSALV